MKINKYIPLRRLKVAILSFSDNFLLMMELWPIPLILIVQNVLKNGQFLKKWPIFLKTAESTESARRIGHFKISTFSRLQSGISGFLILLVLGSQKLTNYSVEI